MEPETDEAGIGVWERINDDMRRIWPTPQVVRDLSKMLPIVYSRMIGCRQLARPKILVSDHKHFWRAAFKVPVLIITNHPSPIALCYYGCDLYASWLSSRRLIDSRIGDCLACLATLLIIEWKFTEGEAFQELFLSWIVPLEDWTFEGDLLHFNGLRDSDRARIELVRAFGSGYAPTVLSDASNQLKAFFDRLDDRPEPYYVADFKRDLESVVVPTVRHLVKGLRHMESA